MLHQGLARAWGLSLGTMVIIVSLTVLVLWISIKQKPGLGTLANAVLLGLGIDLWLALVPVMENLAVEIGFVSVGTALSAVGTALYIGADLGPGADDRLMTGFAARGFFLRKTRTVVEPSVLLYGWLIGGTVWVGTVLFAVAVAVGPMVQVVQVVLPRVSMAGPQLSP